MNYIIHLDTVLKWVLKKLIIPSPLTFKYILILNFKLIVPIFFHFPQYILGYIMHPLLVEVMHVKPDSGNI